MIKYKTYLRALELDDYIKINKWHQEYKIYSRVTGNKYFIAKARDKEWVKSVVLHDSNKKYWAICLKENDEMIGYFSVIDIDWRNRKANIGGITIGQEYQNLRMGHDALDQVLKYVFNELGLNKLYTTYLENHIVTGRGIKKFGFKEEVLLREEVYKLGKYHNVIIASLLRKEYITLEQQLSNKLKTDPKK
ncbi:MAG: GNAT family protein [Bacteroidota bacterium]